MKVVEQSRSCSGVYYYNMWHVLTQHSLRPIITRATRPISGQAKVKRVHTTPRSGSGQAQANYFRWPVFPGPGQVKPVHTIKNLGPGQGQAG